MGRVVAMGCVALLGGALAGEAQAKKLLKAKINGKGFKSGGIRAAATTNGTGGIILAGSKGRRTLTSLTIGCSFPGLSPASVFPVTAACGGGYGVAKLGASPIGWATDDGIAVTIESYDGRQLKGTFSGVFERPGEFNPTDAPAPVEAGKFSLPLLGG
jgi:hypothetical protein